MRSDWLWAGWVAGGLVSFAALEAAAVQRYPDVTHTFTVKARKWLGIYPQMPRRATSSIALVSGFAMFAAHLLMDPPEGRVG